MIKIFKQTLNKSQLELQFERCFPWKEISALYFRQNSTFSNIVYNSNHHLR